MNQHEEIKNGKRFNFAAYNIDIPDLLKNNVERNNLESLISNCYKVYDKKNKSRLVKQEVIDKTQKPFENQESLLINDVEPQNLFRLCVKSGEHVYARPNDIIMIESCDHLVNVYLAFKDKIKKTIRTNTLKDFLLLLPAGHFIRLSRFCAININRISGGNWNDQTFEFDYTVSIKVKHSLPQSVFKSIGR